MANVYLISTADNEKKPFSRGDFDRIAKFASYDEIRRHSVVGDPNLSDIVIFFGSSSTGFWDILKSRFFRDYRDKSILFFSGDRSVPILPGIYAGLERRWSFFSGGAAVSGFYLRVAENDSMDIETSISEAGYLFSFVGNAGNHSVRNQILRLSHERGFVKDTSSDEVRQADGVNGINSLRGYFYRSVIENSKFVLCPRGIGVSSWRLFETMRAGRVPVIISDDWIPPEGPDWSSFSIRIRERDVMSIPKVLAEREREAEVCAQLSRQAWETWYRKEVIFNTVVELGLQVLSKYRNRNRLIYAGRWLQYLSPFFFRYWGVSPVFHRMTRS